MSYVRWWIDFVNWLDYDNDLSVYMYIRKVPQWHRGKEFTFSVGDMCSIPGSRIFLGEKMATHLSILAWEIPCIEKPGRL